LYDLLISVELLRVGFSFYVNISAGLVEILLIVLFLPIFPDNLLEKLIFFTVHSGVRLLQNKIIEGHVELLNGTLNCKIGLFFVAQDNDLVKVIAHLLIQKVDLQLVDIFAVFNQDETVFNFAERFNFTPHFSIERWEVF
jgi:hypothetical protein